MVFLAIPVFCVFGPAWLVQWSSGRLSVVLIPLVAAAVEARLVSLYSAPPFRFARARPLPVARSSSS